MNPTQPMSTTAFPYTNPYTQRKTQAAFSSSQSPQQQLEHSLQILVRSRVTPPSQTIEQLFEVLQKANEQHNKSSSSSSSSCWTLSMAESLVVFVIRIFGCHENINMTGRNPDGYPSTLCFLARCLEQWSEDDSIMYAIAVKEMDVEVEGRQPTSREGASPSQANTKTVQMSLLQLLHNLSVHFDDPIVHNPAMLGLSIIWRYMDRVSFLTSWKIHSTIPSASLDSAWWMPTADEPALANTALKQLLGEHNNHFPKMYMFPSITELRIAWTSILLCLLKRGRAAWFHEDLSQKKELLSEFFGRLLGEVKRLGDSDMTSKHAVNLSIASAALCSLIESKQQLGQIKEFHQLVDSTNLIDSIFRSYFGAFGPSSPNGPRWTYGHKDTTTQRWMEEFIYVWSLCKDSETCRLAYDAVERHWEPHIADFCANLLGHSPRNNRNGKEAISRGMKHHKELFSRLLLLYSVHHDSMRKILVRTMTSDSGCDKGSLNFLVEPCQKLLQALLSYLNEDSHLSIVIYSMSLLRTLLGDRISSMSHDEMSRSLWKAVQPGMVSSLIQKAVELANENDLSYRPLLLCILDILDSLLSSDEILQQAIHMINTDSLEALIHVMVPKDIRIDQAGAFMETSQETSLGDGDTETPPVNNLSRFDEVSMCIEKEEQEKPVGLDKFVRLSVAAVLARIGYLKLDNPSIVAFMESHNQGNGLRLIQSRIRTAVTEFVSHSLNNTAAQGRAETSTVWNEDPFSSIELTRRRFRLLVVMAVQENEDFLSSFLFSKDKEHENHIAKLKMEIEQVKESLNAKIMREQRLENEKASLRGAIDSQSMRFWREINRVKKSAAEQTQSKVAIFEAERKMAEHRAHELTKSMSEAEKRITEAEECAEASQKAEAQARQELQNTQCKLKSKEEEAAELQLALEKRDASIAHIEEKFKSAKEKIVSMEEENGKLRQLLEDKKADISELQGSRESMEQNLDCLFGDLVKLCHMYEAKDKAEEALYAQNDSLSRKLKSERSKSEKSERELLREKELLQSHNEKLERKLAKYKEKLEAERRKAQEVEMKQKNYGPVSYINKLHDSMNSSVNASRHHRTQKNNSSSRNLKEKSRGKENEQSFSSQSKASDNYYFSSKKSSSSSSCLRHPYR